MKILYGVQGTGNGHLARARAMVPALRESGLVVDCLFTGRAREEFFNMEPFGDFACYEGLSLKTERGRMNYWATLTQNRFATFLRDLRQLDLSDYDLVISDFEPLSAWAARLQKVPSLAVSHQAAFNHAVPKVQGYTGAQLLMRYFAPTDQAIGVHWHHFNHSVLPPIIEAMVPEVPDPTKIVVYMGFEELDDIVEFLGPFNRFQFIVYARVPAERREGHIVIKPLSHEQFHADLRDCSGVISNAGFELSSECLALGKKVLVKPLLGQFEQLSNALALQTLSRGTVMDSLNHQVLAQWLEKPNHKPIRYPDVARAIARWLADGQPCSVHELASSLWSDRSLPINYDHRFGRSILTDLIV